MLGESSSAFLRGNETAFRNARSPNSRGRLSLNLNNRTPTKRQKGKTDGADPRPKKQKENRNEVVVVVGVVGILFMCDLASVYSQGGRNSL